MLAKKGRPGQPKARQPSLDPSSSPLDETKVNSESNVKVAQEPTTPTTTPHSPHKGARIGFRVKFNGFGSSSGHRIASEGSSASRLKRVNRKEEDGWIERPLVSTYNAWQIFDSEVSMSIDQQLQDVHP